MVKVNNNQHNPNETCSTIKLASTSKELSQPIKICNLLPLVKPCQSSPKTLSQRRDKTCGQNLTDLWSNPSQVYGQDNQHAQKTSIQIPVNLVSLNKSNSKSNEVKLLKSMLFKTIPNKKSTLVKKKVTLSPSHM